MRDGVADVLAQRATLDRGAGVGIVLSLVLHGALTALVIYAATHASAPQAAPFVSIEFAQMPAAAPAVQRKPTSQKKPVEAPKIEEPKPKIEPPKITEPKPAAVTPPKVEKGTVPLDPFGRSTKKGSETPPAAKPAPASPPTAPSVGTTTGEIPIGGFGVTGLEGGDFPHTLYLQGMQRRIGSNWFRPPVPPGTSVVVSFRILRDGTISEEKVEISSGNGTFDRAALSAVRSSSKLNRLPSTYNGTYLGVRLIFL